MDLERRGKAALDLIPADDAGTVTVEAAARALRPGTRVLTVSSAQYATGAVTDLRGLGRLCRERGVLLCVDGIQTVGALPLDVKAAGVHFLSADSHKWMLGMMGIGAVFVDRSVVKRIHPHRRHILTFSHPDVAGEALEEGLATAGVVVSLRRGRIRVSPHLHNTFAEMERVADAVRALLRPRRPASPPAVNPGGTP